MTLRSRTGAASPTILVALLLLLAFPGVSWALVTDPASYPEPPLPALPPAGGTFVDPTFGTTIVRVTDANTQAGKWFGTAYSYWPTFNRTSTRFWAFCEDGSIGERTRCMPATSTCWHLDWTR